VSLWTTTTPHYLAVIPLFPTCEGRPWSGTVFGPVAYWDPILWPPCWNLTNTALLRGVTLDHKKREWRGTLPPLSPIKSATVYNTNYCGRIRPLTPLHDVRHVDCDCYGNRSECNIASWEHGSNQVVETVSHVRRSVCMVDATRVQRTELVYEAPRRRPATGRAPSSAVHRCASCVVPQTMMTQMMMWQLRCRHAITLITCSPSRPSSTVALATSSTCS